LEIFYLDAIDSTQLEVKRRLLENKNLLSCMVVAKSQSEGMGSRENSWDSREGNLFFSFCLPKRSLPNDLPLQSSSIYFGYLFKFVLEELGSKVWLKWPNDLYVGNNKIGGVITQISGEYVICGIGLNLIANKLWHNLDLEIDKEIILNAYIKKIEEVLTWQEIFISFSVEFEKSKCFITHINNQEIKLSSSELKEDGSLLVNGQKVYSLR
jgi:BirA family biotin operon repressor/biotin-[acetyl-CoA-carboxylase] ligase